MTISTQGTAEAFVGNGVTTAFPLSFVFFDEDELEVIERVIATGAETVKTLTTDYTVSGGDGASGTVTAVSAPASTVEWHIRRKTDKVQETAYVENDPFPAATHERALDRAVAMSQENAADIGRALRLPKTEAGDFDLTLPAAPDRAGMFVAFDSAGDLVMSDGGADDAASAAASAAAASASASAASSSASSASSSASAASASASSAATSASDAAVLGGALLTGTSTTSLSIATGSKTFTTQANKAWTLGMRLRAASDDGLKFMEGPVTAYSGTSLTLAVDLVLDTGTHADWNIGVAGVRGATGATGAGSGDMLKADNLSGMASAATSRSNIGAAASATTITGAGLASGGGDLSANRTITVTAASQAEAEAGSASNVVMTPQRTAQAIAALAGSTASKLKQIQYASSSAVGTTSTTTPFDDTIPQSSEGAQFLTASVTPGNSSNRLLIEVSLMATTSGTGDKITVALFKDSDANAIAAVGVECFNNGGPMTVTLKHEMAAGTTSAIAFKVRAGPSAGTLTVNGTGGNRRYSTLPKSSLTIFEYAN